MVEQINAAGSRGEAFAADVRDAAQVRRLADAVTVTLGPIDILVLNATGLQPFLSVEETTWQNCLDQLEFFVKSPLLLT